MRMKSCRFGVRWNSMTPQSCERLWTIGFFKARDKKFRCTNTPKFYVVRVLERGRIPTSS